MRGSVPRSPDRPACDARFDVVVETRSEGENEAYSAYTVVSYGLGAVMTMSQAYCAPPCSLGTPRTFNAVPHATFDTKLVATAQAPGSIHLRLAHIIHEAVVALMQPAVEC